jgi:hypothetical protein
MGDAERVAVGRQRRSQVAVPVEIDPEVTPPPCEPPNPSSLRGYESIPPPIRNQLDMLAAGLGDVTRAIGKIWDARQDGERFDRIDAKLGTLASAATRHEMLIDQFVMPAIKDLMTSVDKIATQLSLVSQQLETTSALLQAVDGRLRTLEGDLRVMAAEFNSAREASAAKHVATQARLAEQDARIETLERKERDREVVSKALAKRERRKAGSISAGIATVVAAIIAALARVVP